MVAVSMASYVNSRFWPHLPTGSYPSSSFFSVKRRLGIHYLLIYRRFYWFLLAFNHLSYHFPVLVAWFNMKLSWSPIHSLPVCLSVFFSKLMDGLRCIDEFTYRCLDNEHRNYFNTLYQGTTQVIIDLCKEGAYQSGKEGGKDITSRPL